MHTTSCSHVVRSPLPTVNARPYFHHLWPVCTIWWRMLSIWWNTCLSQCFPCSNSWQSHCAELTTLMRVHSEVNYPLDKTVISRSRKFTLLQRLGFWAVVAHSLLFEFRFGDWCLIGTNFCKWICRRNLRRHVGVEIYLHSFSTSAVGKGT